MHVEMPCEPSSKHRSLIEFALHQPLAMQGHRDDGVEGGVRKVLAEVIERQLQKWAFQLQLATVLEEMNGLPQRPFIATDGTGTVEGGWAVAARTTSMFRAVCERHWRPEGASTTWAIRRLDETDEVPTGMAESSRRIVCDRLPATIAVAGKDHINQPTAEPPYGLPHSTPLALPTSRETAQPPLRSGPMSRLPPRSPRARP